MDGVRDRAEAELRKQHLAARGFPLAEINRMCAEAEYQTRADTPQTVRISYHLPPQPETVQLQIPTVADGS
jgi:hypothetical protein